MIVTIHQPNFIPWLGFFNKVINCDIFVILDDVEFSKDSFINRNKIRTSEGWMWLTIPVKMKLGEKINEVIVDNSKRWYEKHKKSIIQLIKHYLPHMFIFQLNSNVPLKKPSVTRIY